MKVTKRHATVLLSLFLNAGVAGHLSAQSAVNVTQHHNHITRDGLYVDPAFTYAAASNLTRDLSFNGAIFGNVYAQPLYIEGAPSGRAMVIAVTDSNNVYALDAADGSVIWTDNVGAPCRLPSCRVATSVRWASSARPSWIFPPARSFLTP
jgi:outer membrane protein assembly factor BamB